MLQAALFDMDGVIVDNRDAHLSAFVEFARRHGLPDLDATTLLPYFGSTNAIIMGHLFGRNDIPAEEIEHLSHEKEEIYRELYDPIMQPAAGLITLLKELKNNGIKIAVGSSAPRINVDFVLDRCGIAEYFDAVASGSEITRSKPDPEVYLLAARKLDIKPEDCIVFEDAFVGMEAARRARAKVVAVASTFSRPMIEEQGDYDLLVNNFTQVTLPELAKLWK